MNNRKNRGKIKKAKTNDVSRVAKTDEVNPYELKTSPKQLIKKMKLEHQLKGEQKKVSESFYKNDFIFVFGEAGSGKTFSAVHTALNHLKNGECNEIWITRPILPNNLGILPGELRDKLNPYIFPILQNLYLCIGKELTEKLIELDVIKIMPIDVAKGCTFNDAVVIVDEFEDINYEDFRTIISRVGETSKMFLCGSKEQISRKINTYSCIFIALKLEGYKGLGHVTLVNNHRNKTLETLLPLVDKIAEDIKIEHQIKKQEKSENIEKKSNLLLD